jgi:hypothetical protein
MDWDFDGGIKGKKRTASLQDHQHGQSDECMSKMVSPEVLWMAIIRKD